MKTTYLLLLGILCSYASICQTTVTCPALIDNTLRSDLTSNSSGASPHLFVGMTNDNARRRALIKFDLSQIPAGATITSATLTLRVSRTQTSTAIPVSLYKVTSEWGQGTSSVGIDNGGQGEPATTNDATWLRRLYPSTSWTTQGGDFVATASATSNVGANGTSPTWSSSQMATDIQNWVANPNTNFGWLLKSTETGSKNTKRLVSAEGTAGQRPTLSVTYTAGTLPVTIANLTATESEKGVKLAWQTQSEFNNSFFGIEHSTDGVNFSTIGKVNGAGTSNTVRSYSFLHQLVSPGNHYYRLAQTDINRQVRNSNVVQIVVRSKHNRLTITPNPVTDAIYLDGIDLTANPLYSISNTAGAIISIGKINSNKINASYLIPGFYMLTIVEGSKKSSGVFIKQ